VIPVQRVAAPTTTQRLLSARSVKVMDAGGTTTAAREEWARAHAAKQHVRKLLHQMAHGVQRCMYCEDSLGTDIDHFQPIAAAPMRAFEWPNHLLACSHCNSNHKRDEYPCDASGDCLLVDPSTDDPSEHLTLLLASGAYLARTPKGHETIRVFALNRGDLMHGRRAAFVMASAVLRDWNRHRRQGRTEESERIAEALWKSPFGGVVRAMRRLPSSLAPTVLGEETAAAINEWRRSKR
jgi:uncharacterized protein (TIGR02646 family)